MKTIRMRIELTSEQRKAVDHNIDANRLVYNSMITACKNVHRKTGRLPTVFDLSKLGTQMRHNHRYIRDAYSTTLNATSKRVIKACEKTLSSKRHKGERKAESTAEENPQESNGSAHFPRYRPKGSFSSYTYPVPNDFSVVTEKRNGKKRRFLRLGKVPGLVRCYNQSTKIEGRVKTCTVKRKDMGSYCQYYACITYETEPPVKDTTPLPPVAVDVGVSNIAALSTKKKYPNDHIFRTYKKKLAKLQRQLSRALYGSPEYWKIQTKINHLYGKINNHRKNNVEQISSEIAKNFSVIVMEDLSVRALRKISLSRAMTNGYNDASLGLLRKRITDKASSAGHDVILVDPRDTSQLCSSCGMKVPKDLSVRTHVCPYCRYVEDRDVNSCENMLKRAGLMGVEWIDPLSVLLSGEQNSRAPGEGCAGTAV